MNRSADAKPKGFHIVWEDDSLVVVHKGPGLLSVPDSTDNPALSTRLTEFLTAREGKRSEAHPLHRLDKDVSGLLVFAKTNAARDALRKQFAEGVPDRMYLAVARGRFRAEQGTFRSFLDTKSDKPRSVAPDRGVPAITHYKVLAERPEASLVQVELETGRKNQIRVHFSEAGHPLLGDRKFNGPEMFAFDRRRIALHAFQLRFQHPVSGEPLEFVDPAPAAFEKIFPGRVK
jgi:23S rRNA pseudouridine1911/1915/1917 synthase